VADAFRTRLFPGAPPLDAAELAREAAALNPGLPVELSPHSRRSS
jgi:hypothetical protein